MKKLFLCVLAIILAFSSVAFADAETNVAALLGPTGMAMAKLMKDESGEYNVSLAASVDLITPKLVRGEIDIACVPANLASTIYNNADGFVRAIAVNTLGILYIVERGDTVHSIADLAGRTVYASGKGATPEYALNYLLSENGVDAEKDVNVIYKSEHAECLAALINDDTAIAMLPQPFVTVAQSKKDDIRIALDMSAEWDALQTENENGSAMVTGVIVARSEFIDENPEAVEKFLSDYAESVAFVNGNVDEAAEIIGEYNIVPADVAKIAIPYCNIVCVTGSDMRDMLSGYLGVLFGQNPDAVGGALPPAEFYYGETR